jgi:hypothetical protein
VEIPVISASVRAAPNSPTVAVIQVPPLADGTRLLPRSIIHLFFLDFFDQPSPYIKQTGTGPTTLAGAFDQQRLNDLASADATNNRYKLLFGGELVGFQWAKSASGNRSLVLQCEDWSNYWDYAYQFENTDIFGPSAKAIFSGGATNLFTDFLVEKGSILTSIVTSGRCNTYPAMGGLAAGIIRLIEAIGGSYFPPAREDGKPVKKFAGQNIFFSLAELRLHITQMVAAVEKDQTSIRLLKRQGYAGLFDRALGGLGGQTSIRQAINALSQIMFYETYGQPCPRYVHGLEGSVHGDVRVKLTTDSTLQFIDEDAQAVVTGIDDVVNRLNSLDGPVTEGKPTPWEKMVADQSEKDRLAGWGLSGFKSLMEFVRVQLSGLRKIVQADLVKVNALRRPELETVKGVFSTASAALGTAITKSQQMRPKAPPAVKKAVTDKLEEARHQLTRINNLTVSTTKKKDIRPARLCQQVFRPDIWFGSPPRCNVLFPERYHMLQYERKFLQEPTRLLLKTNDEFFGEDFLFDKFYFAPQAGSLKKNQANLQSMLKNNLLDHELFTGILPVFEKMGEFNVFAAQGYDVDRKALGSVSYAQRAANFIYFKHRFNSRQMRVSGMFNPYIACGFPGLVIDKYVDAESVRVYNQVKRNMSRQPRHNYGEQGLTQIDPSEALGTNFLANFTAVSHTISQEGPEGRTDVTCSYPRQPEETVRFLGSVDNAQMIRVKQDPPARRDTIVAALNAPKLYSVGPNNGVIVNAEDVTVWNTGSERALYTGTRRSSRPAQQLLVPVGVEVTGKGLNCDELSALAGSPDRPVVLHAWAITEEVPRYRREQADLPMEEYIRPGWYGDTWDTQRIGAAYQEFFATGSINDAQQVMDFGRSTSSQKADQAAQEQDGAVDQDDPWADAQSVLQLDEKASIKDAVDFLLLTYSYIKQSGLATDEFIRAYTWRPIATMVDMLGTNDLEYDQGGQNVVAGREGFHSRAFGPYNDLFGLVGPDLESMMGIRRDTTVAQHGDTRMEKLLAVQRYATALRFSRGILG